MNIAVTGSHGYIGSILCRLLKQSGHTVHACDWEADYEDSTKRNFHSLSRCSFDETHFVTTIINEKVDVIFHLAATSLVGPSFSNPITYFHNNTARTTSFVSKLVQRNWKGHIIFASSAAVYGNSHRDTSFSENDTPHPCNFYGRSKLLAEEVLNSASVYDIKVTSFRFFNVVGAYEELGEETNDTHLLSRLSDAVIFGRSFEIYGDDYPTRDGTCIRDYIHVLDVCKAMMLAMNNDRSRSDVYNLGTSKGTSVKEVFQWFCRLTKTTPQVTIGERRLGDPFYLVADPTKFCDEYNFEYTHSSVEEMITSTWNYYKEKFNYGV